MSNNSVCAVVVTYNRKNLLIECLEGLINQTYPIKGIYIIDNASTDKTPILLKEKGFIKELPPEDIDKPWEEEYKIKESKYGKEVNVHYVRMHENTGGAGGFYEGVKRAFEKGYDWLWLMDDDAEVLDNTLEVLIKNDSNDALCLCPLIVNKFEGKVQNYHHKKLTFYLLDKPISNKREIEYYKNKVFSLDGNAFVGPLIKRKAVELVGFPNPHLFIWGDDLEYIYRLSRVGKVLLIGSAIIYHKDKPFKEIKKLDEFTLKKYYYYFRNKIFFIKWYSKFNLPAYMYYFYRAIKHSIMFLIRYKSIKGFTCPLKGILDGLFKEAKKVDF